ncbi:MAG: flagellar basal body-associated FliL family protein [Planctomycetaceae bacterium]
MSTELADAPIDEAQEPIVESPRTRRFALDAKKIRVLGLLAVIMAGQALLMLLFLPAPVETPTDGAAALLAEDGDDGAADLNLSLVEVAIDEFNTTNSRATPGSIIHVSFKLVAIVAANEREPFATAVNGSHEARVREAIEKVVRSTSLDDLRDPSYVMLKRRIKSDINKVLRKSYVIEAVIRDFKTIEQ